MMRKGDVVVWHHNNRHWENATSEDYFRIGGWGIAIVTGSAMLWPGYVHIEKDDVGYNFHRDELFKIGRL